MDLEIDQDGLPLVLLIDDDVTIHDLVRRFLHKEGFRTVCAQSGPEGIELARKLRPSIIVLDVMMPTMDGWSVLTRLKGDPEVADIPVVMLTMVDNKEMGFSLGVDDYMLKPIERSGFVSVLRKYCTPQGAPVVLVVEDDTVTREMMRSRWSGAISPWSMPATASRASRNSARCAPRSSSST